MIKYSLSMDISPTKRERIIVLAENTSMTYRQIAENAGVGLASVSRVIKQNQRTRSIDIKRKGNFGRKRKTTAQDDRNLLRTSVMDSRKTEWTSTENYIAPELTLTSVQCVDDFLKLVV